MRGGYSRSGVRKKGAHYNKKGKYVGKIRGIGSFKKAVNVKIHKIRDTAKMFGKHAKKIKTGVAVGRSDLNV